MLTHSYHSVDLHSGTPTSYGDSEDRVRKFHQEDFQDEDDDKERVPTVETPYSNSELYCVQLVLLQCEWC